MDMARVKTLNYKYSLKRILPMVAMAGAGLMASCNDKPVDDPYAEPIDPVKVLKFGKADIGYDSLEYSNVMKYANDPRITKIIYFVDSTNNNNYTGYNTRNISKHREWLQERLDYTPKATGAGTFMFRKGQLLHEDSVWFVANGWNAKYR